MLAAVEYSMNFDYSQEFDREMAMVNLIADRLADAPGITTGISYPRVENGRPHLQVFWDRTMTSLTVEEARQALINGEPSIQTPTVGNSDGELEVGCAMLKDEEVDIVVRRFREVLAPRG